MERYLCIHGHFYQPPRENPWLEAIEIQDSARPYHDWNERISAECYAPNSAARLLDGENRIVDINSNYSRISFNFGPTLLSWMEAHAGEIYRAILDADAQSMEWRSGHGNAIAQPYNHIIMPLANRRDKRTQIAWGVYDFEHRFNRPPEGMWLPEAAVDVDTLDMLAEYGIKFTILAQHQALKVRKTGTGKWKDVSGGRIDPTKAYVCRLPSGRRINIFFYDGAISRAVAFERILERGEDFADRLMSGFSDLRRWPQILSIATDGESYGHHHKFGDMALAYGLNYIESNGLARLTNYGEYLENHPPTHEVEIAQNSSWSCFHGIERWRSDCGCNSGGHQQWNQGWRAPLRQAFDWLRDQLAFVFENKAKNYLRKPWQARDGYIAIVLDRSEEVMSAFMARHAPKKLSKEDLITVLKLLEMQRHAMLMYTSCGWFFDEISGIETVQVMQYAGRAMQLSEQVFGSDLVKNFLGILASARSNIPGYGNGARIYEKLVMPAVIDLKKVGVHYAVSSLFEEYAGKTMICCYSVKSEDRSTMSSWGKTFGTGRISIASEVTGETEELSYGVLHMGDHDLNAGVRTFISAREYGVMKEEIGSAFQKGSFTEIVRLMDKHFGMHNYSLLDLFRDEQRKILNVITGETVSALEGTYRRIYDRHRVLMGYLKEAGIPIPRALSVPAGVSLALDLRNALQGKGDIERIRSILADMAGWNLSMEPDLEFIVRRKTEEFMKSLAEDPSDLSKLRIVTTMLVALSTLPSGINLWEIQNIYFRLAKTIYKEIHSKVKEGDKQVGLWTKEFSHLGEILYFNVGVVLPEV